MAARYSNIRQGRQLNDALGNYITYLQTPRTPKINSRGDRPPSQVVYVVPFGQDLATDEVTPVNSPTAGVGRLSGLINAAGTGGEVLTTLGAKTPAYVEGFNPARLVTFENATKTKTVATSDVTKLPYLKYTGERFTCAFGRKTATDDLEDVFQALYAAARARTGLQVNRISLVIERFKRQ